MALTVAYPLSIVYAQDGRHDDIQPDVPRVITEFRTLIGAYIRVATVKTDKHEHRAFVQVFSDATKARLVEQKLYVLPNDTSGPGSLIQAYLYLKGLPEFTGAVDC